MRAKITIILLLAQLLCPIQSWGIMDLNSDTPIHISADKMVSNDKEKAITFTGNVKAKQGALLINSQVMTVYHGAQKQVPTIAGQENSQQIEKIIATGNVEIVQEGFVATGDQVEYFASDEKVVLTGNAKIIQDNNMVTGHQVEMDLKAGTTTVTPFEGERVETEAAPKPKVEMYFYPKSDTPTK